jgi:hypothetical protein
MARMISMNLLSHKPAIVQPAPDLPYGSTRLQAFPGEENSLPGLFYAEACEDCVLKISGLNRNLQRKKIQSPLGNRRK